MHRPHCIDANVLAKVTASLSAAAVAGMKELQCMCQDVPDGLLQPVTAQMGACASAAGQCTPASCHPELCKHSSLQHVLYAHNLRG